MESASMSRSEEGEDLISQLPSDVLLSILEKLQLGDAVRAGALSRRWRSLPRQLPRLALDFNGFLPGEEDEYYEDEGDDDEAAEVPADSPPDNYAQASEAMLQAMVALLASRRATACDLAVSFLLRRNYMSIGRLLDDAMASGKARAIEMTISSNYDPDDWSDDTEHKISVMIAYGRRFRTLFDGCPAAFGGLTRLALENMELRSGDLDDILAACTRLETMSLDSLTHFDAGPRVPWRVRHARLAGLTIDHCGFGSGVDLAWLPRLERFTYRGWFCPELRVMSFGHVPRLATVTLSNRQDVGHPTLRLSHILMANTAVTDLRLNFKGQNIWVKPECPKRFANMFSSLKHVKIRNLHEDCGLSWISFLLQVSPSLKELNIKVHNFA
ncbi:unnamed protein product [Urochloa humidicola]